MKAEPSLQIGFDVSRTKAVLRAGEPYRSDLTRLAARFPGGGLRGRLALELSLDDFLVGIDALADWPHPESVEWDDEFGTLVGGSESSLAQVADGRAGASCY